MKKILPDNPLPGLLGFNRLIPASLAILLFSVLLSFSSCRKGLYGEDGWAFVSLTWIDDEPEYFEIENDFIPRVFFWDYYYRVEPGLYFIYYEGVHRRGGRVTPYAWELEYEVWVNEGERGKAYWQVGEDGPDAYFTIECSPFGPEVFYEEIYPEKSASLNEDTEVVMNDGEVIIVEKQSENYTMQIRYRKVEPHNNRQ